MDVAAVERRWVRVADQRVALSVVELGLACCGLEVRAARRAADLFADVGDAADRGGTPPVAAGDVDAGDVDAASVDVASVAATDVADVDAASVDATDVDATDVTAVDAAGVAGVDAAGQMADGGGTADVNVLVVAGTVTSRLAPELAAAYAQLPEPRAVLAFGACAATGGPYWDSYSVLPGAHTVIPVDVWVPGCPPRPADLIAGLQEVLRGRR